MATPASVFLSTWRDEGVILYEVNPRYHTKEAPIILGFCHGVSRYYHLPDHQVELIDDCRLWDPGSLVTWLTALTAPNRSPLPEPASKAAPFDSWDPQAHPPIL
jgi:hypothetical protein